MIKTIEKERMIKTGSVERVEREKVVTQNLLRVFVNSIRSHYREKTILFKKKNKNHIRHHRKL